MTGRAPIVPPVLPEVRHEPQLHVERRIFAPSQPEETREVIMGAKLSTFLWQHPVAVLLSGEVLRD